MDEFRGKVVLITGSSSGLGAGTAVHFAGRGARLSLTGLGEEQLRAVASDCVTAGMTDSDILTTEGDLTDEAFRSELIKRTIDTFGQLDVLVNNAGGVIPGLLSEPGMESFHKVFAINLAAPLALTKLALPHLLKVKGNIINISSIASFVPLPNCGVYCMSKAGVDMFTKSLALELGPKGVRVNCVNPGVCRTAIFRSLGVDDQHVKEYIDNMAKDYPVGRAGEPEDVARAVAFLASNKSSFITGESLVVDGGGRYVPNYITLGE